MKPVNYGSFSAGLYILTLLYDNNPKMLLPANLAIAYY